jgi:hypothetical protein
MFTLGCLFGAVLIGVLLEGVATALPRLNVDASALLFASLSSVALAVDTAATGLVSPISWRRQTCAAWVQGQRYGLASFAWGVDLGVGFTTFRTSSIYWIGVLGCLLFVSAPSIPLVMVGYAVGLTAAIATIVFRLRVKKTYSPTALVRWSRPIRYCLCLVSAVLVGVLIAY